MLSISVLGSSIKWRRIDGVHGSDKSGDDDDGLDIARGKSVTAWDRDGKLEKVEPSKSVI